MSLRVVGNCCSKFETSQTFESTNPNSLFCDHRSVAQQYWSRLDSSSNIVEPRTCITNSAFICMLLKKIGRQRTLQTGVSFYVTSSFNYFELAAIKVLLLATGPRRIHSENKILFAFLTHFIRVIAMNISIPGRSHRCHDPINRCTVTGEGGRVQQTCSKETAKLA